MKNVDFVGVRNGNATPRWVVEIKPMKYRVLEGDIMRRENNGR